MPKMRCSVQAGKHVPDRIVGRSGRLTTWAFLALAVHAACGAATTNEDAPAPGPSSGGSVVFADKNEPSELNCVRAGDAPALRICRLVSDSLLDYDANLNFIPRLAESFETDPSGTRLTFHLRRGVKWHDGEPLTSKDVAYTIRQLTDPKAMVRGNRAALFEPLIGLDTPDDFTVIARYREPFPLAYEGWVRTFILPAHLPFKPGESSKLDRSPVGTGPWRFVAWDPGQRILLEANDQYFAGRPHLDRLAYRYLPEDSTHPLALKTGEVQLAAFPPHLVPDDDAGLPFRLVRYDSLALVCVMWNVRDSRGLFKDPRVRRAVALAFDRASFVRTFMKGHGRPAVSSFYPLSWAHDPQLEPLPYDPAAAGKLLEQAGWRDRDGDGTLDTPSGPASFTLNFFPGRADQERIATLLQAALKPLGVDVHLQGLEFATLRERVHKHEFEATTYSWTLDADPDPYDFFHSSQYPPAGLNMGGYSNPVIDRLSEEGRRTLDVKVRASLYHRAESILRDEQPFLFIYHPESVVGVARSLQGVEIGPAGLWGWWPSTLRWWIPAADQRRL